MTEACASNLPVLVFAPFGKDGALIERVLNTSSVHVLPFSNAEEFSAALGEHAGAAVITEEVLHNGSISTIAQRISSQPPWSDFPIIVLTGSGMSTESTLCARTAFEQKVGN